MNAIDKDVVGAIAQEIASQVGELRYNLWFRENARLELTENELLVGVPNLFFQEWLSSNFLPSVRRAVEAVVGRRVPVRVVVDGEMFRAMRARDGAAQAAAPPANAPPAAPAAARRAGRRGQTLENFVVGPSNRMAHAAATELVRAPTARFNPLVLYGALGLGKTHLLRGIAHGAREAHPDIQVVFLSAEAFTNSFLDGLRGGRVAAFRQRLRGAELVLIDDVQFVASKRATVAELLHTYEALDAEGRQVVVSLDRHPRLVPEFSDELVSRLVAGMCCPIEAPDLATRLAIVEAKCQTLGLRLEREVIEFVATHLRSNVRELEGAVHCLKGYADMTDERIELSAAQRALADLLRNTARTVSLKDVEHAVCQTFELNAEQLRSPDRSRSISQPRMLAMYLARKHTGAAYDAIGSHFGGRNHSTVMFAERKVQGWIDATCTVQFAGRPWPIGDALRAVEQKLK